MRNNYLPVIALLLLSGCITFSQAVLAQTKETDKAQFEANSASTKTSEVDEFADLKSAYLAADEETRMAALAAYELAILRKVITDDAFLDSLPVVNALTPSSNGQIVRCTLRAGAEETSYEAAMESSGDQIPMMGTGNPAEGSIFRFAGTVKFPSAENGATFVGDSKDPISFLLLDRGLVYLHGKGEVIMPDGSQHKF